MCGQRNQAGDMEEIVESTEEYVPPLYTGRNRVLWMGTPDRPIPPAIVGVLYRRSAVKAQCLSND